MEVTAPMLRHLTRTAMAMVARGTIPSRGGVANMTPLTSLQPICVAHVLAFTTQMPRLTHASTPMKML